MKPLLIIFCVSLSVSAELSTQKFILSYIYSQTQGGPNNTDFAPTVECLRIKMEVSEIEISESEIRQGAMTIEKIRWREPPTVLQNQIIKAFDAATEVCQVEVLSSRREKLKNSLQRLMNEPEIDEN